VKTFLLSIVILAIALIGFSLTILFKKGGKFPQTHIGENDDMKKRGLSCASKENLGCNGFSDKEDCCSCALNNNM